MMVKNPIIWADFPDPDIIRIDNTYYMVCTTMFVMPGGPILKSKDLYHWDLVSYIFETIEENDIYQLSNGKNAYGRGQWATSLKYHEGIFYACFTCHDMKKTYIYYTDNIEKTGWSRYVIEGSYHDMSFLFDQDKAYLIYGNGDIRIVELRDDLSGIKENGVDKLLFSTPSENIRLRCEGCRAYKINEYYYLMFIEWPADGHGRRGYLRLRSASLAKDILTARNTLTQRTSGPHCAFTVELDTKGMNSGDYAGIVALQGNYGMIGVRADENGLKRVVVSKKDSEGRQKEEMYLLFTGTQIFLKIEFNFENSIDIASFYFSTDGNQWRTLGTNLKMAYTLDLFIGYRIGVFYYSRKQTGGVADFRNFRYVSEDISQH